MRYRGQISISMALVILGILLYFSWPIKITGFAGFTAGTEANLTIWDETDNESLAYANQTRYPGDIVFFFANYTNATDGTILNNTIANCSINFSINSSLYDMWFNETKQLWEFSTIFSSSNPNYNFSVNCSALGTDYDNLTATDNFKISDNITPSLIVESPINGTNYSSPLMELKFTASDDYLIDRCWYTNTTGQNITLSNCSNTTFYAKVGTNNITVYVNDTSNNINSTQIFFTVDLTTPNVNLISPKNYDVFYTTNETENISIEFTATDNLAIDKCWYELSNGSLYDLPNCENTTILLPYGQWIINISANDSAGNIATAGVLFDVYTSLVTVCSSGCNFTNINDALSYVNGTNISVLVNESGTYVLNSSYYLLQGTVNLTGNETTFGIVEGPVSILLMQGPVNFNCNFKSLTINNTLYSGAVASIADNTVIENCTIYNSGIGVTKITDAMIKNNAIYNPIGAGIISFNSTNINILNNTIRNVSGDVAVAVVVEKTNNALISNNSINICNSSLSNFGIYAIGKTAAPGDFDNISVRNNVLRNNCSVFGFSMDDAAFSNNTLENDSVFYFSDVFIIPLFTANITNINVTNNYINNANASAIFYSGVVGGVVANNTIRNVNISYYLDVSQNILIENNSFSGIYGGLIINSTP